METRAKNHQKCEKDRDSLLTIHRCIVQRYGFGFEGIRKRRAVRPHFDLLDNSLGYARVQEEVFGACFADCLAGIRAPVVVIRIALFRTALAAAFGTIALLQKNNI
ncbi:hypothetical protein [Sphingopyxis sp.]|uniref:hypothetical protein n=1 Tax=Sphingopyxis sp. TaxID=1908224 RepID=UPI0025E2A81B|nr:hypothetical protein [Sphingopyxis sp.]